MQIFRIHLLHHFCCRRLEDLFCTHRIICKKQKETKQIYSAKCSNGKSPPQTAMQFKPPEGEALRGKQRLQSLQKHLCKGVKKQIWTGYRRFTLKIYKVKSKTHWSCRVSTAGGERLCINKSDYVKHRRHLRWGGRGHDPHHFLKVQRIHVLKNCVHSGLVSKCAIWTCQ